MLKYVTLHVPTWQLDLSIETFQQVFTTTCISKALAIKRKLFQLDNLTTKTLCWGSCLFRNVWPNVYLVELTPHHELTVSLMKREFKDSRAIYCVTRVQNDVFLPEKIKLHKRIISPTNAMQNIFSYKCMTITSR